MSLQNLSRLLITSAKNKPPAPPRSGSSQHRSRSMVRPGAKGAPARAFRGALPRCPRPEPRAPRPVRLYPALPLGRARRIESLLCSLCAAENGLFCAPLRMRIDLKAGWNARSGPAQRCATAPQAGRNASNTEMRTKRMASAQRSEPSEPWRTPARGQRSSSGRAR